MTTAIVYAQTPDTNAERVKALSHALIGSDSFKVRCTAAVALGRMGDPQAINSLIHSMQVDSHYAVRCASAKALGNLKQKNAVGPLLRALTDEEALVQKTANAALKEFHSPEFLDEFQPALSFPNVTIRRAAVEAFAAILINGETSAGALVLQAATDSDSVARTLAIEALTQVPDDQLHPILIAGLSNSSSDVRRSAAELLTKQKTPLAVEPLSNAFVRSGEQKHVHMAIRDALVRHREFMDLNQIRESAKSSEVNETRIRAIRIIGGINDAETSTIIQLAIKDSSPAIRVAATRAVMDSSEEDLRSVLANAMEREKDKRVLRQMTLVYNALNK